MKVNNRPEEIASARAGWMIALALAGFGAAGAVHGKFTTADCPEFKESEFRYVKVVAKNAGSDPTLAGIVKLDFDMQIDKDVLAVPSGMTVSKHTGGAMDFDAYGDLWLTIGNNSPDQPELVSESDWAPDPAAPKNKPERDPGQVRPGRRPVPAQI